MCCLSVCVLMLLLAWCWYLDEKPAVENDIFIVLMNPVLRNVSSLRTCEPIQVVVVREPLARAVAVYYWLGRRPASLRKLVGIKDAVTNLLQPPPVVKATHYAKNLPEAYTGPGASDLPRWPWHSFAWGAAEAVAMLEDRQMAVVVLEHYDESLLALRRLMKWPMAEVLYTVCIY